MYLQRKINIFRLFLADFQKNSYSISFHVLFHFIPCFISFHSMFCFISLHVLFYFIPCFISFHSMFYSIFFHVLFHVFHFFCTILPLGSFYIVLKGELLPSQGKSAIQILFLHSLCIIVFKKSEAATSIVYWKLVNYNVMTFI